MTKKLTLLFTLILCMYFVGIAQIPTGTWYFGSSGGLTWCTTQANGDPIATNGSLITEEGCAVMSDPNCNLLFYTDGMSVWNTNHTPMPNSMSSSIGGILGGDNSSTQSAFVVQKPGSLSEFYVFTVDANIGPGGLKYSKIDMTLDGGLGDVVSTEKNVGLVTPCSEKINGTRHSNGTDYWVISHAWGTNEYLAYLIDSSGVTSTPVVSSVGVIFSSTIHTARGYLKVSQQGNKIAVANEGHDLYELFDFDASSGILSNPITLSNTQFSNCYGVEFSHDGHYLYGSERWDTQLWQWDISLGTATAIQNSIVQIATLSTSFGGALQIASDNKIYLARNFESSLGRINSPTLGATACNYVDVGVTLAPGAVSKEGLPNLGISNINPYSNLAVNATPTNVLCAGDSTGEITLSITGGVSPYSVNWSTGDTTQTIQGLATGYYEVTVVDMDTITIIDNFTVASPAAITQVVSTVHIDTTINALGALNLNVSGGTSPYTYLWSNGGSTNYIDNLSAGNYTCTFTDSNGCQNETGSYINYYSDAQAPIVNYVITPENCFASCNASIDITSSGGVTPHLFTWSTGASTEDIDNLCADSYDLTVYDANGAPQISSSNPWDFIVTTNTHTVNIDAQELKLNGAPLGNGDFIGAFYSDNGVWKCAGYAEYLGSNLSVTVHGNDLSTSAKDGFSENELLNWRVWSATSSQQYILIVGYDLTPPNAFYFQTSGTSSINAGDALSSYTISAKTTVNFQVVSPTPVLDNALFSNFNNYNTSTTTSSDGWIDISTAGGVTPYSFTWSTGASSEDISSLMAGSYHLTITDGSNCEFYFSYTLYAPNMPFIVSETISHESCDNLCDGTINLSVSGGQAPYNYSWSNGEATKDLSNLCPGTYDVTITQNSGPVATTLPWSYAMTSSYHTILVNGGALNTINTVAGDYLGVFFLTNGLYQCGGYQEISDPTALISLTARGNDAATTIKEGFDTGEEILFKIWRNSTGTIENLGAVWSTAMPNGNTFTPTGMSAVDSYSLSNLVSNHSYVIQDASPIVISETITLATTPASSDGSIAVSVSGGTPPYSYSWNTGETTSGIANLATGTYSITVTDANACTHIESYTLTYQNVPLSLSLQKIDPCCYGGNSGAAWVSNLVGVPPFAFLWSNGASTDSIWGLTAGMYTLTVWAGNGDQLTQSVEVLQPAPIIITGQVTPIDLPSSPYGSIDITVTGGNPPYLYDWITGSQTEDLAGVPYSANYTVTVTDYCGCQNIADFYVDYATLPSWDLSASGTSHNIDIPSSANIVVNGVSVETHDFLGVFYDDNGTLKCGGYVVKNPWNSTLHAYADDTTTSIVDGFLTGDEFHWKLWDASTNTEYLALASYDASYPNQQYFAANGSSGIVSIQTNSLSGTVSTPTKSMLPSGMMVLYQDSPDGIVAVNKCPVTNGNFMIEGIAAGEYLLFAVPQPDQGYGIPGYYVDKLYWDNAAWVEVVNHTTSVDLLIEPAQHYTTGTASISGEIIQGDDQSYNPDVFGDEWFPSSKSAGDPARNIPIILFDNQMTPMDFRLSNDNGEFLFEQMEYGSYFIRVEKAGLQSDALPVTLDAANSQVSGVEFILNQGQVISVEEPISENEISIYPNPVSGDLHIILPRNLNEIEIELFTITGQKIELSNIDQNESKITLYLSSLASGVYMLHVTNGNKTIIKKISKL